MSNEGGNERLWVVNAGNGAEVNSFPLQWDTPDPFGVGDYYPAGFQPHCNDYNDILIWYTLDFNVSYDNHYDQDGRGMDGITSQLSGLTTFHISELSIIETSLNQSTWSAIKTAF